MRKNVYGFAQFSKTPKSAQILVRSQRRKDLSQLLLDGKLNISGYAYWGYGKTDGNRFQLGTEDGYYDNAALALAVRAQATDDLSAAFQFTQDEDYTQNGVDYAFFEYRVSDEVRVRFGMPKVPIGLSWDVNDVGTLRPFLRLPSSVYGNTAFGGYSYLGVGVAGTKVLPAGFELGYDVFAGGISQFVLSPYDAWAVQTDTDGSSALGVDSDFPGFWEQNGYHMRGDPWAEERYGRPDPVRMRRGSRK